MSSKPVLRRQALAATIAVALTSVLSVGSVLATDKVADAAIEPSVESIRGADRFIVRFRPGSVEAISPAARQQAFDRAIEATRASVNIADARRGGGKVNRSKPIDGGVRHIRRIATGADVIATASRLDVAQADEFMRNLSRQPNVQSVEIDQIMRPVFTPDDPGYPAQWGYHDAVGGINAPAAWDAVNGSGVVVAVIDTGITNHWDLNANILPGYDMISHVAVANDGDLRDADASDPGDWISAADNAGTTFGGALAGCPVSNSSWHGTHVSGTVAAVTNNSAGVAGVAFGAKVVPVRVLGKCGGFLSDIADGIIWAAGGTVPGVPANANPAKVINLSLGGSSPDCGSTYQAAVDLAVSRGATVVVAAGNSNAYASGFRPANCGRVLSIASNNQTGIRSSFSNYGVTTIDFAAPGGFTNPPGGGILSTLNTGTTAPGAPAFAHYVGTSMAAPHVAGVAALAISRSLSKPINPLDLQAMLTRGARAFPVAPVAPRFIGSGIVNAVTGVQAAAPTVCAASGIPSFQVPMCQAICERTNPPATQQGLLTLWTLAYKTNPPCGAGGGTSPSQFANETDFAISDLVTFESPISVAGRIGYGSKFTKVTVDAVHTWEGDVVVTLVAPDGSTYSLHNPADGSTFGTSADNVIDTFVVDASSELANGTWKLRVFDRAGGDIGTLRRWQLDF